MNTLLKLRLYSLLIILVSLIMLSARDRYISQQGEKEPETPAFNFKFTGELELPEGFVPLNGQVSKDGQRLYVAVEREISNEVYVLNRDEETGKFSEPKLLSGILSDASLSIVSVTVSADEKTMIFVSSPDRTQQGNDLYIATRTDKDNDFADVRKLHEISDPMISDCYPWLSPDGLRLYFTKQKGSQVHIYEAGRTNPNEKFISTRKLDLDIPIMNNNMSAMLTNDELQMFVVSDNEVFYTTRYTIDNEFSPVSQIADADVMSYINGMTMTPDMAELYIFNVNGYKDVSILQFDNMALKDKPLMTKSAGYRISE